jgi:peroxiredoxin
VAEPAKSPHTRLLLQNLTATILRFLALVPITPLPKKNSPPSSTLPSPFLGDFYDRKAAAAYGVPMPQNGMANRATFVVDKEGKIRPPDLKEIDLTPFCGTTAQAAIAS